MQQADATSTPWAGVSVLVTGGAGFVGSHLVERLVRDGADVRVLDDLSTGCEANLQAARAHGPVHLLHGDVTDPRAVRAAVAGVRRVFHLAAVVGVPLALRDPLRAMRVNVRGTEEVCEAARAAGVERVLLTSSSEVYGDRDDVPFRERDPVHPGSTDDPRGAYAASKALAEWCVNAHSAAGLGTVVTRLFNTVGPRQRARQGMVLPRFVEQALRGLPLTIYGDGTQRRCFADVRDVARVLARLGAASPHAAGGTFNVGSTVETSIRELAGEVLRVSGSASGTEHLRFEDGVGVASHDVRRRVPDLARLAALGIEGPSRPLADTLRAVLAERVAARGGPVGATPRAAADLTTATAVDA